MDRMNIKKIARIANVDSSTVSRALRNSPRVKLATKEKILKIAKECNYIPNEIARSLKTKETKVIGLIVSDIKNPFFTEIISGAESYLTRNNYSIILCNTNYSSINEKKFLNILLSKGVEGIIISPTSLKHLHTDFLNTHKIPNVLLDIKYKNLGTNCVYVDQELGAYSAIKYLFEKGHKKIAFMAGPKTLSSSEQAITGFIKAHKDFNIPLHKNLILKVPQNYEDAYIETLKLLKNNKNITAIFSLTDFMCIGIYRALQEMNLKIPKDIAVVGYDDLNITSFLQPLLTTVKQPNIKIGKIAAKILLDNIKEKSSWKPQTIRIKPELIIREST